MFLPWRNAGSEAGCTWTQVTISSARTVDSPEDLPPVAIVQVHPVGNYAYNIHFDDGHSTGIFPLELLLELGEE